MSNINHQISHMFANHNNALKGVLAQQKKGKKINLQELEFALAVLLVELAGSDQNFDSKEYHIISNGLRRLFGTDKAQVAALINQASQTLGNLRGTGRFATQLKESLDADQRKVVMDVIEEVIAADGVEDGFETYLRHKFRSLLGLEEPKAPAPQE